MNKRLVYILASVLTCFTACKKLYNPQLVSVSTNFLAVDGNIISGDSTIIALSRTTSLSDAIQNKAELKAIVAIESDQGSQYPLIEKGKGVYVRDVTILDPARKYRLNIKTNDGKVYQSEYVPMKVSPPIDSVYAKLTADGEITFYVDTHDATNNTRYYRWDYKDTWRSVPIYSAKYKYKNGVITSIDPYSADDISKCYNTSSSTNIIVGSSAKLTQDIIAQHPFGMIQSSSEKIAYIYVIQLGQYALTKEAFEYYQNLKSNTEQLGSIFDPQASTLLGNIHCITKPSETVIGFVSASTTTKKQFNLDAYDFKILAPTPNRGLNGVNPYAYPKPYYMTDCSLGPYDDFGQGRPWKIPGGGVSPFPKALLGREKISADIAFASGDSLLYDIEIIPRSTNTLLLYAPKICIDCRLKGGTNIKPAYYPR